MSFAETTAGFIDFNLALIGTKSHDVTECGGCRESVDIALVMRFGV